MRFIVLVLLAWAAPAYAQSDPMRPTTARWDIQELDGNRYLRATSENGDGAGKLMFLCNGSGQLVLMAMLLGADSGLADAAETASIVVDGAVETAPNGARPIFMNESLVSLLPVEPARFQRLMAARAAGIAWNGRDGARLAGFQVALAEGRGQLAAFARECSPQNYP